MSTKIKLISLKNSKIKKTYFLVQEDLYKMSEWLMDWIQLFLVGNSPDICSFQYDKKVYRMVRCHQLVSLESQDMN